MAKSNRNGDLAVMLIGKTGEGKSDTGNTIIGEEVFESTDNSKSVTKKPSRINGHVLGRDVVVVDTPGCMDTEVGEKILDEIADAVFEHTDGYDAFLIVMKYPFRFTPEAKDAITQLEKLFGKEFYKYSILVVTHGDSFMAKQKKSKNPQTFEQFIANQELDGLMSKISGRAVLLNNMEADDDKRDKMIGQLFEKVEKVGHDNGGRFTDKVFKKAEELEKDASLTEDEKRGSLVGFMKKILNWFGF